MLKENLFIAENQGLDVDEQKKNDILSFIKSCKNFQDFIRKLGSVDKKYEKREKDGSLA